MDPITVFTKPACAQCDAVFRALDKMGIDYHRVDISTDPDAREYVMALGYLFSLGFATVSLADQRIVGTTDAGRGRWIADHTGTWLHGSATDAGHHYPMAVLTMAHGEARCLLCAGTLLPEAARLAGAEDLACPDQAALEALRHNAISSHSSPDDPAAITDAVTQLAPAGTSDHQRAALIWYYTLIPWGAGAP